MLRSRVRATAQAGVCYPGCYCGARRTARLPSSTRAGQTSATVVRQREDVLDLADAGLAVEHGVRHHLSDRFAGEEARRDRLVNVAAMLEVLLDERLVLAARLAADRLGPERAERRLVDLADVLVAGPVGPVPLHQNTKRRTTARACCRSANGS